MVPRMSPTPRPLRELISFAGIITEMPTAVSCRVSGVLVLDDLGVRLSAPSGPLLTPRPSPTLFLLHG
eukprot:scaffold1001_cov334-Prasinococcus_capsulatus_cf.AAC.10